MTHIKTGKGSWLFVEVPEGSRDFRMFTGNYESSLLYRPKEYNGPGKRIPLPEGSYTFIGTTKDISEEQILEIIEAEFYYDARSVFGQDVRFKDYEVMSPGLYDATESLRSLLIANQLNPELNYAILKNNQ